MRADPDVGAARIAGTMTAHAPHLSDAIQIDCERAIRRLDVLIGERDDVLLHQARAFVRHAAVLAAALSSTGNGVAAR
jgi:hypothetical protein